MSEFEGFGLKRYGALGAVVDGVDLKQPLAESLARELERALDTYGVLFFDEQYLSAEQQLAVASRFGEVSLYPIEKFFGSNEPSQQVIVDDADNPPATDMWHTDVTWLPSPPVAALITVLELPAYGGDTMWGSTAAAYDDLSDLMKERLDGLRTVHSCHDSFVRIAEEKSGITGLADKLRAAYPAVSHPLVRVHPRTGRRSLYLAERGVMHHIEGLAPAESEALLDFLDAHIAQPKYHIRWRWQPGQLAIWDERTTVHRGVSDHYPQRRVIRRCTVDGEVPIAVADSAA